MLTQLLMNIALRLDTGADINSELFIRADARNIAQLACRLLRVRHNANKL